MNENQLQYYYPFRFLSSRKHLSKIITSIKSREDINSKVIEVLTNATERESKTEPNRWFDESRLRLRAVTEVENIYSFAKFRNSGSNVFNFSQELLELLENTDVEDIQFENIQHPYKNYYISFRNLNKDLLGKYLEYNYKLDGVYISNEIENAIIIHLSGFNEVKNKSWWFNPDFTNINTLDFVDSKNTVKFALENLLKNLKERVLQSNSELGANLDRTFSEIEQNIKLIINCILYISTQKESLTKEYPADLPSNLISKLLKAKTKKQKEVIQNEIKRNGFTKITFAKLDNAKNKSDGNETGIEVNPHWRRGHWRKQPCGTSLTEVKLIWIKPTIVRKDKGEPTLGHIYSLKKDSTNS